MALQRDPTALQTITPDTQVCSNRDVAQAWAELVGDLDGKKRKITIDPQNFKRFLVTVVEGQKFPNAENQFNPAKQ
jgi:hypothetical protein